MTFIALTMRADKHPDYDETRDALDQQWLGFMQACGLTPILLPNNLPLVVRYLTSLPFSGVLLTGGNSPVAYGGDSPERDAVDRYLLDWSAQTNTPLIGVCRGMQSIQLAYQQPLEPVTGHVCAQQEITVNGQPTLVNSYHTLGAKTCQAPLTSWATSNDGVIKAIKHESKKVYGMMWHPERNTPFAQRDIDLFRHVFLP
jgi:gamma-glutamyl-gamma-aminobutyrate hydrolase PuuD